MSQPIMGKNTHTHTHTHTHHCAAHLKLTQHCKSTIQFYKHKREKIKQVRITKITIII